MDDAVFMLAMRQGAHYAQQGFFVFAIRVSRVAQTVAGNPRRLAFAHRREREYRERYEASYM